MLPPTSFGTLLVPTLIHRTTSTEIRLLSSASRVLPLSTECFSTDFHARFSLPRGAPLRNAIDERVQRSIAHLQSSKSRAAPILFPSRNTYSQNFGIDIPSSRCVKP